MSAQQLVFIVLAGVMLGFSLAVIISRNQVYAAMNLVGTMFCMAALYALLSAHTIAVLQVLVYAGAIVVLFLFVIMLLSIQESPRLPLLQAITPMRVLAVLAGLGVAVVLVGVSLQPIEATITKVDSSGGKTVVTFDRTPFRASQFADMSTDMSVLGTGVTDQKTEFDVTEVGGMAPNLEHTIALRGSIPLRSGQHVWLTPGVSVVQRNFGTVAELGTLMYSRYLLPFEVTSLLLLVAIVGAVVVAKGKI